MQISTLKDLFAEDLKDLYDAEHQITQALPKMAQAVSNADLRNAFQEHLRQTEGQIRRLEQVFQILGEPPSRKHCAGIAGLIKEGEELMQEKPAADVLDAGLLAGAQKVEHYEMAGYGTLRTWARQLGCSEAAQFLQQTLDEEGETDKKLTRIAEQAVNQEAENTRKAA